MIGLATFIVLYFLGARFSLLAAILNGSLEFIPFIGPIIAALLILIMNISMKTSSLFFILLALLGIQYLENIISPIIRGKILNINPLVVIFALAVGSKLGGVIGVLIAVPLSTILTELAKDLACAKFPNSLFCKVPETKSK